jgi:ParB family chromosome partitioning protein
MQVLVDSIKVPDRVRKDLGNLDSLMESLKTCGQLNPITVTRDMQLVAGFRRLTAARNLGWKMITANVVDAADAARILQMEMEENFCRKDFTPEELLAGYKRLEELRHPKLSKRIVSALKKFTSKLAFWKWFKKDKKKNNLPSTAIDYVPPAQEDTDTSEFGI